MDLLDNVETFLMCEEFHLSIGGAVVADANVGLDSHLPFCPDVCVLEFSAYSVTTQNGKVAAETEMDRKNVNSLCHSNSGKTMDTIGSCLEELVEFKEDLRCLMLIQTPVNILPLYNYKHK